MRRSASLSSSLSFSVFFLIVVLYLSSAVLWLEWGRWERDDGLCIMYIMTPENSNL